MPSKNKKVLVAMSGGVDSSVVAALLKKEGHDVTGVHILCWAGCENNEDKQDAMRVAARLDIPFLVWDFKKEYKEAVFNYMIREYSAGRTPNPDVMCNKEIKFGIFLKRALEAGANYVATGHYVRAKTSGFVSLLSAKDSSKDQSYFLWTLTQDQLKHCLFPIGDYLKSEVREIARKFDLPTAAKKDSQGLCFVGKIDFGEFLREALPKKTGAVLDSAGNKLGEHDGAHFYTLGQRHGLGIGGEPEPLFVADKNIAANTLVVARGESDPILYRNKLIAENLNWIKGTQPSFPLKCLARIRYRQLVQKCVLNSNGEANFDAPQRAVSPGQSIVFYSDSGEMLGGGIIKS